MRAIRMSGSMSGVWKRSQGRTSEAPPDERGGNRYVRSTATAPHPDSTDWLAKGVIKLHRTVATYINMLLRRGFAISLVEEWGPTDAQIASRPNLADEHQRPPFLLLAARR